MEIVRVIGHRAFPRRDRDPCVQVVDGVVAVWTDIGVLCNVTVDAVEAEGMTAGRYSWVAYGALAD